MTQRQERMTAGAQVAKNRRLRSAVMSLLDAVEESNANVDTSEARANMPDIDTLGPPDHSNGPDDAGPGGGN